MRDDLFYRRWMSYLSDSAPLTRIVMPGAHNAGSYGMRRTACCQDGSLYEQIVSGVRHFCLRLDTTRSGIVLSHGISKGDLFANALRDFQRGMQACPTEFFILDLREYYPQKIGPFTLRYKAEPKQVDALLQTYIDPARYAYTDFDKIADVTIGDLRRSGKRYILLNNERAYAHSVDSENILPWEKHLYGFKTHKFIAEIPKQFDRVHTDGIYWFQTQQTPNLGTEIGFQTPRKLDAALRKHFAHLMQTIADNPSHLHQANVIGGDFMTDGIKCREILRLNLRKGLVKPECRDAFAAALDA